MPKRKPRAVTEFERELVALLNAVAPGGIELSRSTAMFEGRTGFRITFVTRSTTTSLYDDNLRDGIFAVTQDVTSGDRDPIVPMWDRLTRFQREAVTRMLEKLAAEHMAAAARAKVGAEGNARAEYDLADAFNAALNELSRDDYDSDAGGFLLPETLKLEGPPENVHVAQPRKPRASSCPPDEQKRPGPRR